MWFDKTRKLLVAAGLATIALSLVLDPIFATDATVPEPATTTLLALGGAAAVVAGLVRRRKK